MDVILGVLGVILAVYVRIMFWPLWTLRDGIGWFKGLWLVFAVVVTLYIYNYATGCVLSYPNYASWCDSDYDYQSARNTAPIRVPRTPTPIPSTDELVKAALVNESTSLDLSGKGLTSLPPEIGNLTELNLSGNGLTLLPPEIGNLTNLTKLHLGGNRLGELPSELFNLTNLTRLDLNNNGLAWLSPKIGNLNNLTELNLGGNELTSLPPEIGNLTNLTELWLGSNELTSMPPELGNLTNLKVLNLNGNGLTSLPPELGNLTNLKKLDLLGNRLTSLPPELGNLTNLTEVNLWGNPLRDTPDAAGWIGTGPGDTNIGTRSGSTDMCRQLTFVYDLEKANFNASEWTLVTTADRDATITLAVNYQGSHAWYMVTAFLNLLVGDETQSIYRAGPKSCCDTPSGHFNISDTITFDVKNGETYGFQFGGDNYDRNNFLRGELTVKYLDDSCDQANTDTGMTAVVPSDTPDTANADTQPPEQQMNVIGPSAIPDTVAANRQQNRQVQWFVEQENLTSHDGYGPIEAGICVNSYLLHYDVASDATITANVVFPNDILAVFWSEEDLNATDRVFGKAGVFYEPNATRRIEGEPSDSFDVSGNEFDLTWTVLACCRDQARIITECSDTSISPATASPPSNQAQSACTDGLAEIEAAAASGATRLALTGRGLTCLPPEIGKLTNLTNLYLNFNDLVSLPEEIGNLTDLRVLDLGFNQLKGLPPELFNLTNLTELHLSSNGLKGLPPELFTLTNLTELRLWNNQLTSLPLELGNLTNLKGLDLAFNQLTSLPAQLGNLTNLTWLDLAGNPLTDPPANVVAQGTDAILEYLNSQRR